MEHDSWGFPLGKQVLTRAAGGTHTQIKGGDHRPVWWANLPTTIQEASDNEGSRDLQQKS